jgi:hypothetical protein
VGLDTAAADGGSTVETGPPDDAQGLRADAQRIAGMFKTEGVTAREDAVTPAEGAGTILDLPPDRVKEALEYGAIETNPALFQRSEKGDQYWLN